MAKRPENSRLRPGKIKKNLFFCIFLLLLFISILMYLKRKYFFIQQGYSAEATMKDLKMVRYFLYNTKTNDIQAMEQKNISRA